MRQVWAFPEDETFDIGQDAGTGVAMVKYHYNAPFKFTGKFTGKINNLTFRLEPTLALSPAQSRCPSWQDF